VSHTSWPVANLTSVTIERKYGTGTTMSDLEKTSTNGARLSGPNQKSPQCLGPPATVGRSALLYPLLLLIVRDLKQLLIDVQTFPHYRKMC